MVDLFEDGTLTTRYASRFDAPLLAAVDRAAAAPGPRWTRDTIAAALRRGDCKLLMAESDMGHCVGYAAFAQERQLPHLTLVRICVVPEVRRRGVARHLIDQLVYSVETGRWTCVRMAVRESHDALLAFLRACHFQAEQLVRGGFAAPREDAVMMAYRRGGPLARHFFHWGQR